jgi:predicted phage baseplate assembly protein
MPLQSKPRLDNRTFDQLVEEGRCLLPLLAPGWTDFNYHDPGITLIDLLAWLVETDIYRLDRISQAAYRAFLRLVGIEPQPARAAETILAMNLASTDPKAQPLTVPSGQPVKSVNSNITFTTEQPLQISPARLTAVLGGPLESLQNYTNANSTPGKVYPPLGLDPQVGDALYLGFDRPLEKQKIQLYIWTDQPTADAETKQRLKWECQQMQADPQRDILDYDWSQHYSVRTQWEFSDEGGVWLPLEDVEDETRALTLTGAVTFTAPSQKHVSHTLRRQSLFFIRCRLVRGHYECPPQIQHIAINTVTAHHMVPYQEDEKSKLGGNGCASQVLKLKNPPVVPGTIKLQVKLAGSTDKQPVDQSWHEEQLWDRVGPHEKAYVLSPERDAVLFGDGRYGQALPDGTIVTATYESGGGTVGNVPAHTLEKIEPNTLNIQIEQPFAALGGVEAETAEDAKGRAVAWLSELHRAVTLDDFVRISLAIPGVPVARAQALADYDPALPYLPALGSITVVVVPGCANAVPEPGPDMLCAVEQYLNRRRTVTTELHVVGPSFVAVAISATLHIGPEFETERVSAEAQSKLVAFLDPLYGGADGQGWPIGRDVYRSEVMALLNGISGVLYVDEVSLQVESTLVVYKGYVTWMRVFDIAGKPMPVQAELRIEAECLASQVTSHAQTALESYFQSKSRYSPNKTVEVQRSDVTRILYSISGVFSVERVRLGDEFDSGVTCGNVAVCKHSLIISGNHQLTVSGLRTVKSMRASLPAC